MRYFALLNLCDDPRVTPEILGEIARACEAQLFEDYAPMWQTQGVAVTVATSLADIPKDVCPIAVFANSDQQGALAWHTYSPDGHIYGRAFWEEIKANGGNLIQGANSLSAAISHEILEAMQNPYCNTWIQINDTTFEPQENCDRVEGDSYVKFGVSVSNFLGPRAFRDGPGPYDFMGLLQSPWEIRPGGYCQRLNLETLQLDLLWGREFPDWKVPQKLASQRKILAFAADRQLTHARAVVQNFEGIAAPIAEPVIPSPEDDERTTHIIARAKLAPIAQVPVDDRVTLDATPSQEPLSPVAQALGVTEVYDDPTRAPEPSLPDGLEDENAPEPSEPDMSPDADELLERETLTHEESQMMAENNIIGTVKSVRERTGASLRDAKLFVESTPEGQDWIARTYKKPD